MNEDLPDGWGKASRGRRSLARSAIFRILKSGARSESWRIP